jgi:chromosome segregation ATPase
VQALIRRCEDLRGENGELRRALAEREGRVQSLEDRLLELNQLRQDAVKRIDDLIAQIDQLDARLAGGE